MHDFYGAVYPYFRLGDQWFEVLEDENDGYRSMFDCVELSDGPQDWAKSLLYKTPIAQVTMIEVEPFEHNQPVFHGYHLVDSDGHVWLRFGTDHTDSYYPMFIFDYTPKKAK